MILTGCRGGAADDCASSERAQRERSGVLSITAGDFCRKLMAGQALALCLTAVNAHAQNIRACAVLTAEKGSATSRIQAALNLCNPGLAVVLKGASFESGPLILT